MIRKLLLYSFIVSLLFNWSCKSVQHTDKSVRDIKTFSKKDLLSAIESSSTFKYQSVEVKRFNASYSDQKEEKSFKGFLRFVPDDKVMVSISPAMGIEMFRLIADDDSLGFIDRYNKEFYRGNYDFLKGNFGVDLNFDLLQFLFSAKLQFLPEEFKPGRRFNFEQNGETLQLSKMVKLGNEELLLTYQYSSEFYLKEMRLRNLESNDFLTINYLEYFEGEQASFPKVLRINANRDRKLLEFNISFKSITLNKDLNFPFSISSKYKEIKLL